MNVLDTAIVLASVMLALSVVLAFIRLLRGPSLPDRVVAFDLMTSVAVGITVVYSMATQEMVFLDVAIVLALISFLGSVAFARYLEHRGKTGTIWGQPPDSNSDPNESNAQPGGCPQNVRPNYAKRSSTPSRGEQ
jgi:multicomponent Na+:H+ antiporter subunit F